MLTQLFEQARALAPVQNWPTFDGKELDRTEFLTSSEVARCLRWTFFSKHPKMYPLQVGKGGSNGFADRGHAIEAWFVDKIQHLEPLGYRFEYVGDAQRSFYNAEIGISGTPDGLMYTPVNEIFLLELKSIDPRFNKNNLPKKAHPHQTVQNMALVQDCLDIELTGGILFYIDASNLWDVKEYPIKYDAGLVLLSEQRAELLWDASEPDDLEAEGLYTGDCDLCPFTHYCSQTVKMQEALVKAGEAAAPFSEDLEDTLLTTDEMMEVDTFLEARDSEKQYKAEKEDVSDFVKKLVIDKGGMVVHKGRFLYAKTMAGRSTIDKALLVGKGINVEEVTKMGKPFVQLNIKGDAE